MSYYMNGGSTNFCIKAENVEKARQAILANALVLGISDISRPFSIIMAYFNYELDMHGGNVVGITYDDSSSRCDDDELMQTIAPFVESGSFIEMEAENREYWRWVFKDGKVKRVAGVIMFPEESEEVKAPEKITIRYLMQGRIVVDRPKGWESMQHKLDWAQMALTSQSSEVIDAGVRSSSEECCIKAECVDGGNNDVTCTSLWLDFLDGDAP